MLCLSISASAYDFESEGIFYDITSFTDLQIKAVGVSENISGALVIPSKVTYGNKELDVIEVGDDFIINDEKITSLVIEDGILSIGNSAFKGCINLKSTSVAPSVIELGSNAFAECHALDSIVCEGVKNLGENVFQNCQNLKNISFPNAIKINDNCFINCKNLNNCIIPAVISIGNNVFKNCNKLVNIDLPTSLQSIGDYSFAFSGISNIQLPVSLISIGENAFESCIGIREIRIPSTVSTVGVDCFKDCSSLAYISIGSGLKVLYNIFNGCKNLTTLHIDDSADELTIGYSGVRSLQQQAQSVSYSSDFSDYNRSYYFTSPSMFEEMPIENVYIGRNLKTERYKYKEIKYSCSYHEDRLYAYTNYYYVPEPPFSSSSIKKMEIGPFVTDLVMTPYIGGYNAPSFKASFQNCTHLQEIKINCNITQIPNNTFKGCSALSSIEIPNSVRTIGNTVFEGATSLKEITLGCYLISIGNNAFSDCASLNSINLRTAEPPKYETGFPSSQYLNTVVNIPSGSIEKYKNNEPWKNFWNLTESNDLISLFEVAGIKYLVLSGNNVQIVGETLSSQTNLTIKSSVTYADKEFQVVSIANSAFKDCTEIEGLEIEEGIMAIGNNAFDGCKNLKYVLLPKSVNTLGNSAFKNCSSLNICTWGESIKHLPDECFYGCTSIQDIILDGIESIGNSCFYDCYGLKKIVLPPSIKSLGSDAFKACYNLKEFVIEDANTPIEFPMGSYDGGTGIQKKEVNGKMVQFKIEYYNPFFNGLPIEKLYIGRNLSDSPRYIISGDGGVDYYRITSYDCPFSYLPKLSELIIGEEVSTLGPEEAFIDEVGLAVTPGSFKKCSSLKTVTVMNPTPPIGVEFSNTTYSNASLIVPDNTVSLFQVAEGWKEFNNILDETSTGINDIAISNNCSILISLDGIIIEGDPSTPILICGIDGKCHYSGKISPKQLISLSKGIYIVTLDGQSIKIKI